MSTVVGLGGEVCFLLRRDVIASRCANPPALHKTSCSLTAKHSAERHECCGLLDQEYSPVCNACNIKFSDVQQEVLSSFLTDIVCTYVEVLPRP